MSNPYSIREVLRLMQQGILTLDEARWLMGSGIAMPVPESPVGLYVRPLTEQELMAP